jgi:peptidoglycan/LPS O-acetylase OafA/YrhL
VTQAVESSSQMPHAANEAIGIEAKVARSEIKAARLLALDFTKGALVLIMVLYHWINYFVGADWPYYQYLRFLTPSFIFVTGFLISTVYLSRDGQSLAVSKRLTVRAVKLLCMFIVLNVARTVLPILSSHSATVPYRQNGMSIAAVFISGNVPAGPAGKTAAFYILVPISYLLVLSAVLIPLQRAWRFTFHAACALCIACIVALYARGYQCLNLELVTVGLVGSLIGLFPIEKVNRAVNHPLAITVAYGCYVAAITAWNVPFPLLIVGVCLSVGVIYLVGLGRGMDSIRRHIILLGKYSLFGYVAQIAILQGLSAILRQSDRWYSTPAISLVAAVALTMGATEVLDRLRIRSVTADRAYRAVFA